MIKLVGDEETNKNNVKYENRQCWRRKKAIFLGEQKTWLEGMNKKKMWTQIR